LHKEKKKPMICPRCGSNETTVMEGKPPHAAQEKCSACFRHVKWLSKSEAIARGLGRGETTSTPSKVDQVNPNPADGGEHGTVPSNQLPF